MHEVLYNEAAVGGEDLTGDKACPLRGEECHGIGDILGCSQAAQRRLADQLLHGLLPQHLDHISVDDAGATQFTRMPEGANSIANDRVRAMIPAFVQE